MPSARESFLVSTLVVSACSTEFRCGCPLGPGPSETGTGGSTDPTPLQIEHDPNRPFRSFVAKVAEGKSCPDAPAGWNLQPPLATSSTWLTQRMARYCAYQLPSDAETPGSMPTLSGPVGVVERVVADYAQVLPQAQYVRGTEEGHYAQFRHQLGLALVGGAPPINNGARPYVAIVDTADDDDAAAGWPGSSKAQHGLSMGGIVSAIRCPDGAVGCDDDRLFYARAFSSALQDRASVWSLNMAVLEAVEHWRGLETGAPLVLNMSVGWELGPDDTELEGGEGATNPALTPAEEALFLTLSWASCQRVLAIAAAGNTRGGACAETGPMGPAAWEALPATTFGDCEAMLEPDELGPSADFQPNRLVYSAGGVGTDGMPIVNARPLSEPRRVLHASRVSVPVSASEYSTPLTGTSVASASLSAIAAQYWGLHPKLSAAEVITAIDSACPSVDGQCAVPDTGTVPLIRADDVLSQLYSQPTITLVNPSAPNVVANPSPVSGPYLTSPTNAVHDDRECTTFSFSGAPSVSGDPWPELSPQPDKPICPTCSIRTSSPSSAQLSLQLEADYRPRVLPSVAVLELHLVSGAVTQVDLDLANHTSCTTTPCTVALANYDHPDPNVGGTLADYVSSAAVVAATVSFYVDDGQTTQLVGNEIDVIGP